MQWYNKVTNELQSNKPGATIVSQEYWDSLYGDWEYKDNSFVPPIPSPTKEQLIKNLDTEYNPKFDALTLAWATAYMAGDTKTADARKADKEALVAEYNVKKGAIKNG